MLKALSRFQRNTEAFASSRDLRAAQIPSMKVVRSDDRRGLADVAFCLRRTRGRCALTGPAFCAGFLVVMAGSAAAQEPAAIVEEVSSPNAGVQIMDYMTAGQTVRLAKGDVLVLGYLRTCLRETITGGEVTIGRRESSIRGGMVVREIVECDGGRANLSLAEADRSGGLVQRGEEDPDRPAILYSTVPAFAFSESVTRVEIQRTDLPAPPLILAVDGPRLDLAKLGKSLKPGGTYVARAGERARFFKIVRHASRQSRSVIGRLVQF